MALLAGLAGGPLGTAALARFGPVWWQVGLATAVWLGPSAAATALMVRAWRRRGAYGRGERRPDRVAARRRRPALPRPALRERLPRGTWFQRKRGGGSPAPEPTAADEPYLLLDADGGLDALRTDADPLGPVPRSAPTSPLEDPAPPRDPEPANDLPKDGPRPPA
ncbi:hypothetical protein GA0115245_106011 [Streptomyces sp. di188]|nr:hypothetical protein GA0115245_106011 [Streptomyces sp. di188]SCD50448.1 hypothetical protein GA0115238_112311 [Streptomyces sp. di50b]